jgi:hypothetical protein
VYEGDVLPISKNSINYCVNGVNRAGWLLQQFLKWSGDTLTHEEHFLVLDADTVLISPQVFEVDGKIMFLHSDEHHQPYYDVFERILHCLSQVIKLFLGKIESSN